MVEISDERETRDRQMTELLQELRVALPGVQILFAFLLAVPFAQGFASVTSFQRALFFAVLLTTAVSSILLIAPSAYHRLHFRQHNKEELLLSSNRFAIAGICFLALAMTGAVILITDFLYSTRATIVTGSVAALLFVWFWTVLPLRRRRQLS
jgi:membrane-anchored protein YejM (alkaline phosphatase superfamily)